MNYRKLTIITLAILTISLSTTSASYAQWGELLGGFIQAVGERYIDNSNSLPTSQDKENARTILNAFSNEINSNQNARNATKDAYEGNYSGAIIQGSKAIINAAGNHSYDTYLNSASQINNANREYEQDIQNGMDRDAALDKRNQTIGNSAAESIIEYQDRVARERIEKARRQREMEQQSSGNNYYYSEPSYNETSNTKSHTTNKTSNVKEPSYYTNVNKTSNNNVSKNRSFNSDSKTLSSTNAVAFKTDDGIIVLLNIPFHCYGENFYLSYSNPSSKAVRLNCKKASIKVKYYGNNAEQMYTDACSFVMPAHSDKKIDLSTVFPNLSNTSSIESIKVLFVDTQITDEKEYEYKNNSNNSNNNKYSNNYSNNKNNSNGNNKNNSNDNNSSNSDTHLLTKNKMVKFYTDEGTIVALGIDQNSGRLFYNNMYNDRDVKLSCNKVSIKVKYLEEEDEQTYTDDCSFVMRANTYDYLDWSDVFFSISDTRTIENIKVLFSGTQIR